LALEAFLLLPAPQERAGERPIEAFGREIGYPLPTTDPLFEMSFLLPCSSYIRLEIFLIMASLSSIPDNHRFIRPVTVLLPL
jgi:hypothetical protein